MRTEFLFRVVLCAALSTGCSEAELPESASVPTAESSIALTASGADTVAETGRPVQLKLAIEERFARRDSCRLRVRVATGYATVFLDDTPLTAETESTIPYAIMNKASSSCVVSLNVVPEAAPVVEQTVKAIVRATIRSYRSLHKARANFFMPGNRSSRRESSYRPERRRSIIGRPCSANISSISRCGPEML